MKNWISISAQRHIEFENSLDAIERHRLNLNDLSPSPKKKSKDLSNDISFLKNLLSPLELRRDLLIEHLHKIQDYFGCLSEENLMLLAKLINISKVEVYEVASFYAHFDIVKSGEIAPPKTTIRVCNSLSCELNGSIELKEIISSQSTI